MKTAHLFLCFSVSHFVSRYSQILQFEALWFCHRHGICLLAYCTLMWPESYFFMVIFLTHHQTHTHTHTHTVSLFLFIWFSFFQPFPFPIIPSHFTLGRPQFWECRWVRACAISLSLSLSLSFSLFLSLCLLIICSSVYGFELKWLRSRLYSLVLSLFGLFLNF